MGVRRYFEHSKAVPRMSFRAGPLYSEDEQERIDCRLTRSRPMHPPCMLASVGVAGGVPSADGSQG
jgi:hypothetical protein